MGTTCCYEGCEILATDHDTDGDEACAEHAARSESYVVVDALDDGTWVTAAQAEAMEAALAEDGWTVAIRRPRGGEAAGTYRVDARGGLQILGYSVAQPEALRTALERAAEAAAVAA